MRLEESDRLALDPIRERQTMLEAEIAKVQESAAAAAVLAPQVLAMKKEPAGDVEKLLGPRRRAMAQAGE